MEGSTPFWEGGWVAI